MGIANDGPLIAVVDDDDAFVGLMREVLADEGYRVVVGTVAGDAAPLIVREHPALAVLDLRMGDASSGITVLRALRDEPETAAIPVLICSADLVFLRDHREDLSVLSCEILPKPFDLQMLLDTIRAMLNSVPA